jgi:hypothetical protein
MSPSEKTRTLPLPHLFVTIHSGETFFQKEFNIPLFFRFAGGRKTTQTARNGAGALRPESGISIGQF